MVEKINGDPTVLQAAFWNRVKLASLLLYSSICAAVCTHSSHSQERKFLCVERGGGSCSTKFWFFFKKKEEKKLVILFLSCWVAKLEKKKKIMIYRERRSLKDAWLITHSLTHSPFRRDASRCFSFSSSLKRRGRCGKCSRFFPFRQTH